MSAQALFLIATGVLVFAGAGLITFGATGYLGDRQLLLRRLVGIQPTNEGGDGGNRATILLEDGALKEFARFVTPKSEPELSATRTRLIRAGYRNPSAVRIYNACRGAFGLGTAALTAILVLVLIHKLPALLMLLPIPAAFAGMLIPAFWVERRIEYRKQAAELGFPDALDMLLVCIEAGQGLDQALTRLSQEIRTSNPTLADEFGIVSNELRAGKDRALVLREFAERMGVSDISAFMTVLKQSDEFGVSIADAVRVYAAEMRNKRIMRAEEKANLLPVKLALGGILFTVPPIMLVLAAPSFIMIVRALQGMQE